jgi:hypothetical protein
MTQLNAAVQLVSSPSSNDRRAWVRFPCEHGTVCHPVMAAGEQRWAGQVRDISAGGIGLSLNRRFELGTLLAIQVQGRDGEPLRTLWGRVVHVHQRPCGTWQMGCSFANELSEEELGLFV